ncbi:kinesin-like protein KIF20B isoform X1 [Spodoptera frugiperda]|uniref:Kinesin-like protein KIF20B isoform X1 n=1 Tax=Spodoptera frugiperda TaxID=7108 RepID=A0A9R0EDD0_SPOFR|nr:kinesin-like protein KIF20B isoform X1 [Spodoptera frugiperda]
MLEQRYSDNEVSRRDIPSFIEPRPPLIQNPFMRPRPQKGTNLLELFEEDSEIEEPDLVQVYLRLKPCKVPNTLYEVRSDRCLVTSLDTATAGHGRRTQHNVSKMYTFSKIFGAECSQREIFEAVVKENLRKLPEGQNFTLLTYGASGSGKTYTLMGTVGAPGLVPRSLEYVFRLVDAAQQPAFRPAESGAEKLDHHEQDYELQWVKRLRHVSAPLRDKYRRMSAQLHSDLTASSIDLSNRIRHYVWVSFVEIYNEAVYDLLAPPEKRTKLRIREDTSGNVYVKGATQAFVRSGEEAYDVMVAGKHNLVVAATGVHAHSSRSHCIFTITMLTETSEGVRTSYVRLCDLAGCERARATRNTGARMLESRAINSSLHVLERCLHMLRRKQRTGHEAMVPYRESKLTRLLGTGLSGVRGEAVSMVVTLNPSPEYAHETKHVLSLAAVAQDIQINNTMLTTTLESSTAQDTTIGSSAEVMKLRADNERLHFELVQAQARNKELLAAMEEKQQESANTMRELVEEAKDMTKQYYEAQLEALRCEMEDMIEEYESRLAKVPAPPKNDAGTPSRFLQNKVSQLMTEIAVLEEKLTAERLARARAEKEVEHLRTCIEERDEKAFKDTTPPQEDVMSLSESEQDESDEETNDPFNESLEPIFKKEINRSISIVLQNEKRDNGSIHTIDNIDEECDSDLEESHETLQNDDDSKNSTYPAGEDEEISKREITTDNLEESKATESNVTYHDDKSDVKVNEELITSNKCQDVDDSLKNDVNMTYGSETTFDKENESLTDQRMDDDEIQFKNESIRSIKADLRGTYFVNDSKVIEKSEENKLNSFRGTYFVEDPVTNVSKISESNDGRDGKDDVTESNKNIPNEVTTEVFKIPIVREKSNVDIKSSENVIKSTSPETNTDKIGDVQTKEVVSELPISKMLRGKSHIDMKAPEKTEPVSSLIRAKTNINMKAAEKVSDTLVGKIIRSFKTHQGSDASLRQFEQLEQASKECEDKDDESSKNYYIFGDIKILKEKRTYFDNVSDKSNDTSNKDKKAEEPTVVKEKRTYFDNISANVEVSNKKINNLMKYDEDRSPSIVKDAAAADFEPSTIKKLLGESFTKSDVISSVHKTRLTKKHNSVDIFDGFDSPVTQKPKECQPDDNVEIARKSIEKLVLNQLSAKKGAKTDLEPRLSIREVIEPEDKEVQINIKKEIKLEPMSSVEDANEISKCKIDITKEAKLEPAISTDEPNQTFNDILAKGDYTIDGAKPDNTIEEFENIYKDITAPRATEFELLVSEVNENNEKHDKDETKYNLRKKQSKAEDSKVNKGKEEEIILAESQAKCESKARKRNLRLRRRKNQDDESDDKLKDIVNLQSEFSDVTLDVPAPKKDLKDIPSPEKGAEENLPPLLGIQSCPSKSVTRSRRKLFTPRAEPLEESLSQTGDSNERIYVPRPSYHRPRARRKL